MLYCSNCSAALDEGSRFCHICGQEVLAQGSKCVACGFTLRPNSKFCGKCGCTVSAIPKSNSYERKNPGNSYYSDTTECPECGAIIGKKDVACYSCGALLRGNRRTRNSVQRFTEELADVELLLSSDSAYQRIHGSPHFDRKISLIRSFVIPNDIEEIYEFFLLAESHIDNTYGRKSYESCVGRTSSNVYTYATLSHAWLEKFEQAYQKAKARYSHHELFSSIKDVYGRKMRQLGRSAYY